MSAEPTNEDPTHGRSTGMKPSNWPGEVAHAELRALTHRGAARSAESIVSQARRTSLALMRDSATRRLSAARAALCATEQTGDRDSRAVALAAVAAARAVLDRITDGPAADESAMPL